MDRYDIAVIGAGFGGLMVVANLMRKKPDLKIFWAGTRDMPGRGIAYSTTESAHVLNVRADRMGAWSEDHGDFHKWLETHSTGQFMPGHYAPRTMYGAYLDTIRMQAESTGNVTFTQNLATDARYESTQWHVTLGNQTIAATHLVLAPGNPSIGDRGWPKNETYISDFWNWRLQGTLLPPTDEKKTIVIVGSGLTAIDAAASCRADGFTGQIMAVSPHGRWPQVHADPVATFNNTQMLQDLKAKATAQHYYRIVLGYIDKNEWRSVIDSLRPHVAELWQTLPEREKARFMRHLWSLWNIHRHRIGPEVTENLKDVHLVAGRITKTEEDGTIVIRARGNRTVETKVKAFRVINCTGPSYRSMISDNPIMESLLKQNFLKMGPLSLGVGTPDTPTLHVLGTPLLGERLETTAVPELREQAAAIANQILK